MHDKLKKTYGSLVLWLLLTLRCNSQVAIDIDPQTLVPENTTFKAGQQDVDIGLGWRQTGVELPQNTPISISAPRGWNIKKDCTTDQPTEDAKPIQITVNGTTSNFTPKPITSRDITSCESATLTNYATVSFNETLGNHPSNGTDLFYIKIKVAQVPMYPAVETTWHLFYRGLMEVEKGCSSYNIQAVKGWGNTGTPRDIAIEDADAEQAVMRPHKIKPLQPTFKLGFYLSLSTKLEEGSSLLIELPEGLTALSPCLMGAYLSLHSCKGIAPSACVLHVLAEVSNTDVPSHAHFGCKVEDPHTIRLIRGKKRFR
eukprot:Platyproteum_vivax@DN14304_c0_g1_i1.p1